MSESLRELQSAMAAHVTGDTSPDLARSIRVPEGVDPLRRLALYRDAYPARISESLQAAFPAVAHILGRETFACLAERYVDALPTGQWNLNYVGFVMPGFLRTDALSAELPFLPDLARLEWAALECFHAEWLAPFDGAGCEDWVDSDWERARVSLQPGLAAVRSRWPIRTLHAARETERSEIHVDIVGRPECALVYRKGFDVQVESIEPIEARVIAHLARGVTLGGVAKELESMRIGPVEVAGLFSRWSALGLVCDCTHSDTTP